MKKIFSIVATLIVALPVFVSCNKDNPSGPSKKKQTYSYQVTASVEINENAKAMFDIAAGSDFACAGETTDFSAHFAKSDKFEFSKKGETPCQTHLKFIVTPKAGFTPETGKKYDVSVVISYVVAVIDELDGGCVFRESKEGGIFSKGLDFDEAKSKKDLSPDDVLQTLKRTCDFDKSYTISKDGSVN